MYNKMVLRTLGFIWVLLTDCSRITSSAKSFSLVEDFQFSDFSPRRVVVNGQDQHNENCDLKTGYPCNTNFLNSLCDSTFCTMLRTEYNVKKSVCTCLNFKEDSHVSFMAQLYFTSACKVYMQRRIHDYSPCLLRCEELNHNYRLGLNILLSEVHVGTIGCLRSQVNLKTPMGLIDKSSNSSKSTYKSPILCFCYYYVRFRRARFATTKKGIKG